MSIVLRIFPWGWHREVAPARLGERVARAYRRDEHAALWEVEALGFRYGDTARGPREGEPPALPVGHLPPRSLLMLHVGMGMALARRHLSRLGGVGPRPAGRRDLLRAAGPAPSRRDVPESRGLLARWVHRRAEAGRRRAARRQAAADVAVRRFLAAARRVAAPGFLDAAAEPLGVVARFERRRSLYAVARALAAREPGLSPWFWHGVGRCLLFLPRTFLPLPEPEWRAARQLSREVPPGPPRRNARVGWACGLTLVHLRRPWIVADLLRRHGEELEAGGDGFAEDFRRGVAEAVDLRREVTPGCGEVVEAFLAHRPAGGGEVAERWRRLVEEPGLAVLAPAADSMEATLRRMAVARFERLATAAGPPAIDRDLAPARLRPRPVAVPAGMR